MCPSTHRASIFLLCVCVELRILRSTLLESSSVPGSINQQYICHSLGARREASDSLAGGISSSLQRDRGKGLSIQATGSLPVTTAHEQASDDAGSPVLSCRPHEQESCLKDKEQGVVVP